MEKTNKPFSDDFTDVYLSELEDLARKSGRSLKSQERIQLEIEWIHDQRKKAKPEQSSEPTNARLDDEEEVRCGNR